uniref:Uncharacterized protein n=1 Tax=Cacopsylla melanoneura TaxID=428564 RepID=A0A8D8YUF5_9HEMI
MKQDKRGPHSYRGIRGVACKGLCLACLSCIVDLCQVRRLDRVYRLRIPVGTGLFSFLRPLYLVSLMLVHHLVPVELRFSIQALIMPPHPLIESSPLYTVRILPHQLVPIKTRLFLRKLIVAHQEALRRHREAFQK